METVLAQPCASPVVPDSSLSPSGRFSLRTETAEAGLRKMEIIDAASGANVFVQNVDLTNLFWLPDDSGLIYAASPIYGVPGIYLLDLRLGTTERIVDPEELLDPAYPDGADWFVLCGVEPGSGEGVRVRYLHAEHVDSVDQAALLKEQPRVVMARTRATAMPDRS